MFLTTMISNFYLATVATRYLIIVRSIFLCYIFYLIEISTFYFISYIHSICEIASACIIIKKQSESEKKIVTNNEYSNYLI